MKLDLLAWTATTVELTPAVAAAIAAKAPVAVEIGNSDGRWVLRPDSRVGVIVGDGWDLRVDPRIAISKLMFLLSYSSEDDGWRDLPADMARDDDLFAAIAAAFAHHAGRAISPAPHAGYVSMEDTGTTLRGRVRAADQIARWSGLPLPLELRYDEFSIDIPENQLVLGATRVLLRLPLVPPATRSRLLRIRGALDGVTPLALGPPVQEPLITRLNARYAAAMRLAALILRSAGVSTTRGGVSSTAFVFDMNAVFEDFLTRALGDAVRRHGARLVSQDTSQQLDYQRRIRLKPDMTVWQGGTCRAVLDAKYKPLTTPGFPNADAYQMLAYCTAFGLNRGSLVYAKDEINAARMHSVRNTDVKICVEALDVTLDPNELLAQVDALAGQLLSAREASSR